MSIKDSSQKPEVNIWAEEPVTGHHASKVIQIARTQLLIRFPFFGRLAMRLNPIESKMLPTAAVDPKGRMYYNPHFINACTIDDAMFVIAHEVMHLVQRCADRFPEGGLHKFWNAAADIVVNITLDQAKLSVRKEWRGAFLGFDGYLREKFEKKLITEHIYYELIKDAADKSECEACKQIAKGILKENKERSDKARKEQEKQDGNASNGDNAGDSNSDSASGNNGGVDGHSHGDGKECEHGGNSGSDSDSGTDSNGSGNGNSQGQGTLKHTCGNNQGCCGGVASDRSQAGDISDAEAYQQWIRNILSAAEGLDRGTLPGSVTDVLERLVKPKVSWKDIVRATGTPVYGKERYSWKKNSRRGRALGVHLPVALPEQKGGLVFIDTSGSISEEMIMTFCSEVVGILDAIGCQKILIGLHDTQVYDLVEVGKADMRSKLKFARGGTSHVDCFELANGNDSANGFKLPKGFEVGMIISFTDLATEFPSDKPKWPVIWGVPPEYFDGEVPWGKKVKVEIGG